MGKRYLPARSCRKFGAMSPTTILKLSGCMCVIYELSWNLTPGILSSSKQCMEQVIAWNYLQPKKELLQKLRPIHTQLGLRVLENY
jgi:hypothetical protein